MRTPERSPSPPGWRTVQEGMSRARGTFAAAPLPVKILMAVVACLLAFPAALVYAPFAVWAGRRSVAASLSVAAWGVVFAGVVSHAFSVGGPRLALLIIPFPVVAAAHAGTLGRWFVPCRTVAWTLAWALPLGVVMARLWPSEQVIGPAVAALIACVVLGWRLAKSWQDTREYGRQQARALAAPYSWPPPPPYMPPGGSGPGGSRPGGPVATADRNPAGGRMAAAAEAVRAAHAGENTRSQPGADAARERPAEPPEITVDEAMAELDSMVGLTAVKDQIRSITASIEAARRRALAGYGTDKPMQHFVFLGPPGTGKTAVARIVAKIFYAFGLLDTPAVVEAQRSDLVGEYLGATAIKTNALIDSALGGVLFIDEAYSLVNEGDGQGDRFGNEAVQALLKRAEDDRNDLVIILAGYERQMEGFLATNPGLTSRFAIRVKFPGYAPAELLSLADLALERRGELLDPDARPVLWRMFEEVGAGGWPTSSATAGSCAACWRRPARPGTCG